MRAGSGEYHTATLGECCEIVSGSTPRRDHPEYWHGDIPWATPRDLSRLDTPTLDATEECITKAGYESCSTQLLPAGSVLFSSRAPVGLVAIAGTPVCTNQGFKSLIPGPDLDSGYLYWFLKGAAKRIADSGNGTTFAEVSKEAMSRVRISFPPLAEQCRIAALLDRADAVRRKREESRRLVDELLRSVFLEMFGDPVRNEKGWEVVRLGEVLARPLRNGVSPSKRGTIVANVLTLSAITGPRFDSAEQKEARFARRPSEEHMTSEGDFLICRGNGNSSLVARGKLVRHENAPIVFPDTIIAATPDPHVITGEYLEAVWNTPVVRGAIDSGARTTSGIHKVNQTLLASVQFPLPPMDEQVRFGSVLAEIAGLRGRLTETCHRSSMLPTLLSARLLHSEA